MLTQQQHERAVDDGTAAPVVDIVVPVLNEAATLGPSITRIHRYLTTQFPFSWQLTIVDNGSVDTTLDVANALADDLPGVRVVHLNEKGRGRALRAAWSTSPAAVVAYTDVDLSTDLDALLPLVAPLVSGHSDVAIGTRLASSARVVRGPKREFVSRGYNALLRATLRTGFSDAQCGFKAVRTDVARQLLPLIEDQGWFFDTELLVVAERSGLRIHEVPVDWVDDPDTRVNLVSTAAADLRGVWRILRHPRHIEATTSIAPTHDLTGQLARFMSIGIVSTVVFALLFVALQGSIGSLAAVLVALTVCSVANTAANRRLTFALRGRAGLSRHYRAGTLLGLIPLATTLLALAAITALGVQSLLVTTIVLATASAVGALLRFVLLRNWAFGPR
jgi:putative flippase GtrA